MRLGGGPIPRGRASEDRDLMSYRVKQEFLKVRHDRHKTHNTHTIHTATAQARQRRRAKETKKGLSQDA